MARSLTDYLENPEIPQDGVQPTKSRSFLDLEPINIQDTSYGSGPVSVNRYDYDPSRYDIGGINPYELSNLEDIRAGNQGTLDALARSTANLIGKTGVNVIGGTLGTIYGIGDAIATGEISGLWDNALTTSLDAASEAIGDTFKVYKSADYEEKSLLGRLFTHPIQFTDEFMDTLSFTTGAIVTELLTAGVASAALAPRAMKYLRALDKTAEAADVGRSLAAARTLGRIGDAGTLTRQLATGAAWEASVEARHGAIELKDKMYSDALQEFGVSDINQLPQEVIDNIEDRASNAGLFTFLTNMALVGSSNMMQFPKIFGAGYNTSKKAASRIGREAGEYIDDVLPTTRAGRITRNVLIAAKNPFLEGIVEEGGQSVLSNTANMYWDRKNNPDDKFNVNLLLNSFGKSLKDTYTTGEGWYEIGMGMLIGSLGAPGRGLVPGQRGIDPETGQRRELWTGGIAGSFQQRNEEDNQVAQLVEELNTSGTLMDSMKANYDFLVTVNSLQKDQDRALDNNDPFTFQNTRDDMLHAYIDSRIKSGMVSDLQDQVEGMKRLSADDFYVSFRGEEAALEADEQTKQEFKLNSIQELETRIDNTIEAVDIVDSAYTGGNEDIRTELIYNVASAKNLDIRENELNDRISRLSEGFLSNNIIRTSENDRFVNVDQYIKNAQESIDQEESGLEREELERSKKTLSKISKDVKLTPEEFVRLSSFIQQKPVSASLYTQTITELLEDSHKIRQRREAFINLYNDLFTKEGQEKFEAYQKQIAEEEAKAVEEEAAKEAKKEQDKADKKSRDAVKKKAATQKTEEVAEEDDELILTEGTLDEEVTEPPVQEAPFEEIPEVLPIESTEEKPLLTPEEEATLTSINNDEAQQQNKVDNDNGLVKNTIRQPEYIEDIFRKRDVGNTITSLNINYNERVFSDVESSESVPKKGPQDIYDSEGNVQINSNFDSRLQDPSQFNAGTAVQIRFPSYNQIEERGIEGDYSLAQYIEDVSNPDRIPIAFVDDKGKIIGYLPTVDNVTKNVIPEARDAEIVKNRELRNKLAADTNKRWVFNINRKSAGVPIYSRNRGKIYDKLGDSNRLGEGVRIAIYKNGKLLQGDNNPIKNPIKVPTAFANNPDAYFEEGVVYTVIPTADGVNSYAIPAQVSNLSENSADTILHMLDLFIGRSSEIEAERKRLSPTADFTQIDQTMNAVQNILYVNNDSPSHMFKLSLNKGDRKLRIGPTTADIYNLSDLNKSTVRDEIKAKLQKRYYAVKTSAMNKPFEQFKINENGQLDVIYNEDYNDYLNNESIITTNLQSEPIEGTNRRYYTAQSVIEVSDPVLAPESVPTQTEEVVEATPVTPPSAEFANPLGIKSRKKRNRANPNINEDFSELNTPMSNLDKQVENFMRICKSP